MPVDELLCAQPVRLAVSMRAIISRPGVRAVCASCGEEIVIAKGDRPVARLVPFTSPRRRQIGRDEGVFTVPVNFDAPLPEDILGSFER